MTEQVLLFGLTADEIWVLLSGEARLEQNQQYKFRREIRTSRLYLCSEMSSPHETAWICQRIGGEINGFGYSTDGVSRKILQHDGIIQLAYTRNGFSYQISMRNCDVYCSCNNGLYFPVNDIVWTSQIYNAACRILETFKQEHDLTRLAELDEYFGLVWMPKK